MSLILIIISCIYAFGREGKEYASFDHLKKLINSSGASTASGPFSLNNSHSSTFHPSIIDAALAEENLNVLVAASRSAGLVGLLSSQGPFTVFAPNDQAFANISQSDLEDLLKTNQTLKSVLSYHIVSKNISSDDFKNDLKVTSKEGGTLTFNISSNRLMVNNANITKANIIARNGIIHVIDTILGYEALATQPQTTKDWLHKGIALKDMNKYDEALKAFDNATAKDPKLAEAWYEKGLILEILGRKREAMEAFARADLMNPTAKELT